MAQGYQDELGQQTFCNAQNGQMAQTPIRQPLPEPNLLHFRVERMVNGYIVDVGEGNTSEYQSHMMTRGPRHLVTSREKLIQLLTELAPQPLTKPAANDASGHPIEEKKW